MKTYPGDKKRTIRKEEASRPCLFRLGFVPGRVTLALTAVLLAFCMFAGNALADTIYTFTNASATGRLGPTQAQANSAYSGTTLGDKVTINTQGIQEWTVPTTGTYRIEVWGAGETTKSSGKGARMRGDFNMTINTTLKLAVGQMGETPGGGHGGTFLGTITNQPIIVAGGGAGVTNFISNLSNGSIDQNGSDGNLGRGGNNGQGGHSTEFSSYGGGGGGGFDSNGTAGTNYSGKGVAFVFGALGGTANSSASISQRKNGGFGGGGAGYATNEPAGGGGFSGGGGGGYAGKGQINGQDRFAGGGGSFNSGSNQINEAGANSGHGKVVITLIQSTSAAPVITQGVGPLTKTISESETASWLASELNATDVDTNASVLTWSVSSVASNGTATVSGNGSSPSTFTYAPNADFNGSDSFVVQVSDGDKNDTIMVSVTVTGVNDAPVVANASADLSAAEDADDATIDLANVFNDVDDDNTSITKAATSSNASLVTATVNGNTLTLDYQANQSGTATITVTGTSNS
ncbi:MAG: cadherin-like domain-containing protein, partial [Verrucomicrobia bacterium]|nr:cadherin-like domain-containing protein [Verrucomicrobiota bacterium]